MSENPQQEIAVAEAILKIEDPEAFAEYRRRIDTRDPRGVAVIIADDMGDAVEQISHGAFP